MLAYRQHLIVENPRQVILKDLPLQAGQLVEVLVLVNGEVSKQSRQAGVISIDNSRQKKQDIEELLDRSWGCVGKQKTLAEIDADIAAMRQEWVREWD